MNNIETDTPETDAHDAKVRKAGGFLFPGDIDFMRKLERGKYSSLALADDLAETLSDLWHHYSITGAAYDVIEAALSKWRDHKEISSENTLNTHL